MKRSIWHHSNAALVAASLICATALSVTSAGAVSSKPSAPRGVHASGSATSIQVRWSRPRQSGGAADHFVVTSHPSSRTCATASTSCIVKGLAQGRSYTFSVVAKNRFGVSTPSSSNRVRILSAKAFLVSTLTTFANVAQSAINALASATTTSGAKLAESHLTKAFSAVTTSLGVETWPANAVGDVASLRSELSALEIDTIKDVEATTSNESIANFTLQADTNKEILTEASVFTDLGLADPVISPIATTPTPVALGATQVIHDFFGDELSVAATAVSDPATAAPGSGLPETGDRFVAIGLNISNAGTGASLTGDANFSTTVIGSDGKTYSADFGSVSGCTNFVYGQFQIPASDSASGCVVFELPMSVNVQSIEFTLASGYLDTAEWSA